MTKNKLVLLVLMALSAAYLFTISPTKAWAQQQELNFEKNTQYDIYYQFENYDQYVKNVKINDTVKIGETTFLKIELSNSPTAKFGYVSISNIIAILPAGSPRPQTYQ